MEIQKRCQSYSYVVLLFYVDLGILIMYLYIFIMLMLIYSKFSGLSFTFTITWRKGIYMMLLKFLQKKQTSKHHNVSGCGQDLFNCFFPQFLSVQIYSSTNFIQLRFLQIFLVKCGVFKIIYFEGKRKKRRLLLSFLFFQIFFIHIKYKVIG